MVTEGVVEAVDGTRIPIEADTVLLHGDGADAVRNARAIREALLTAGVQHRPGDGGPRGSRREGAPRHVRVITRTGSSSSQIAVTPQYVSRHWPRIPMERWRVVHAVAAALEEHGNEYSITGIIPTYDALLVEFDCSATTHDDIQRLLERLARQPAVLAPQRGRQFDIPVVYGGESGPTSTRWPTISNSRRKR